MRIKLYNLLSIGIATLIATSVVYGNAMSSENVPRRQLLVAPNEDVESNRLMNSVSRSRNPKMTRIDINALRRGIGVTFTIGGKQYDIEYKSLESTSEGHIWTGVYGHDEEEVIFTIRGLEVVSEFALDGKKHHIIPVGRKNNHLLVADNGNKDDQKDFLLKLDKSARGSFARHRQLLRLKDISPENIEVMKKSGNVHRLELNGLGRLEKNKVVFSELAKEVLMLTGDETFEILDVEKIDWRNLYFLRQYIDGKATDHNVRLLVNSETQEIVNTIGMILPSRDLSKLDIDDAKLEEATSIAIDGLKLFLETTDLPNLKIRLQELLYKSSNEDEVELVWRFEFDHDRGTHIVYVSANSRKYTVHSLTHSLMLVCAQVPGRPISTSCYMPAEDFLQNPSSLPVIATSGNCIPGTSVSVCGTSDETLYRSIKEKHDLVQADWRAILLGANPISSEDLQLSLVSKICGLALERVVCPKRDTARFQCI